MEDKVKVDAKLEELKADGGDWIVVKGFSAMTKFKFLGKNRGKFNPTRGLPLKSFINQTTGEVSMFLADLFLKDGKK